MKFPWQLGNANERCCECGKSTRNIAFIGKEYHRICKDCVPILAKKIHKDKVKHGNP